MQTPFRDAAIAKPIVSTEGTSSEEFVIEYMYSVQVPLLHVSSEHWCASSPNCFLVGQQCWFSTLWAVCSQNDLRWLIHGTEDDILIYLSSSLWRFIWTRSYALWMILVGGLPFLLSSFLWGFTWTTLYQKFNLCIPRKGIARPQFQFLHSCAYERFIYSQDLSTYLAAAK